MGCPLSNKLIDELKSIAGPSAVFDRPEELIVYEYDAYHDRALPEVVVQPSTADQVARIVRLAARERLAVTARGGGTGLSGGAIPIHGGILLDFNRMHRVLEVDVANRLAVVEPGLINRDLSSAVQPFGLYFAPDPSSQKVSTIGGNIAENAGGPHCLARGMTTNHILGVELVAHGGELVQIGGAAPDAPGYDLLGLLVGSEGTFGIVTKAWVRLLPLPPSTVTFLALFDTVEAAGAAVSAIIAGGVVPSALELVDGMVARALEQAFQAGYPPDVGAILLIDLDGLPESIESEAGLVESVCRSAAGARGLRYAAAARERERLWAARKGALAALALIAPNYYLCDGVVPRSKLAHVLRRLEAVAAEHGVVLGTVAHVGDGNLHPSILFDAAQSTILPRVQRAHEEVIRVCVEAGGTITGEHGVGLEKRPFMHWIFDRPDLDRMDAVRRAFDPDGLFNPGKVLPPPEGPASPPSPGFGGQAAAVGPESWI